jgi:hypothetical protein
MLEHLPPLDEIERDNHILKFRYNFEYNSVVYSKQSKLHIPQLQPNRNQVKQFLMDDKRIERCVQ